MRKLLLAFVALFLACQKTPSSSFRNDDIIDGFELMDGFQIELIASEPLISDPVAMEIDEDGNFYVAEMPGYPLDLSKNGKIKRLIDTDGDGYPDKSEVFADSLTLPMGLMKWKKGLLVADSPDIRYLEDNNSDGKSDKNETILTGFSLSNPQHNMNTPKFGIDNWIYVAHSGAINSFAYEHVFGDKGSDIHFPATPNAPKLSRNADGRNVRFKPNTYEIESLSGESQYGHTADIAGHRLYTDNANHLFHEVIDARYLSHNPNLAIGESMEKFSDHDNACKVYPITENPNHQLLTDVGVVTSSCGITMYDGGEFGEDFNNVTFVGEPVHNLVHADKIEQKGATFTGKRLLENKEFLASKDPWFRPVNFYVGPDGALYVIDYYRQIVEHPEWMSDEVNESGALYNGTNKGRIYRITPKSGLAMNWMNSLNLSSQSSPDLVQLLDHTNAWYRRTAQRLLFQRNDQSIAKELKEMLQNDRNAYSAISALWLLYDWNKLEESDLLATLSSQYPEIRENALQITDRLIANEKFATVQFIEKVKSLASDPNPRVRFQWLCSSSFFNFSGVNDLRTSILQRDIEDHWVGIAAIASSAGNEMALLQDFTSNLSSEPSDSKKEFIKNLSATLTKKEESEFFQIAIDENPQNDWWQAGILEGISSIWQYQIPSFKLNEASKEQLLNNFNTSPSAEMQKAIIQVFRKIGLPKNSKLTDEIFAKFENSEFQENALALLSLNSEGKYQNLIFDLITKPKSDKLAAAALRALPKKLKPEQIAEINNIFGELSESSKPIWTTYLTKRKSDVSILIDEVKSGNIDQKYLKWPQIVAMMNYYDEDIRTKARGVFALNEDRKAILQQYLPAAEMAGNSQNGRIVFENNCKVCHQMPNVDGAIDFGPNLSTLQSRNVNSIITEIINPNNSIADKYAQWEIELNTGELLNGIIVSENEKTIALKMLGGQIQNLDTSAIKRKNLSRDSAMPNGLESNIDLQEMADLIAFIKSK